MRTVLGSACRSYAGRRHARRAREQRRSALHRDLEPGFHPVQREPGRHVHAVCRSATSIPEWVSSASRAIIQGTKNLTDFSGTISNYETDVFRPIFDELEKLSGKNTRARCRCSASVVSLSRSRQPAISTLRRQQETDRRRLPRHRRSHPRAFVRDRRRNHSIKRRPRLRFASHSCVERFATDARSVFTSRSSSNSSTSWRKRWATSFRKSARNNQTIKETIRREEEAFNKTLDKGIEDFRSNLDSHADDGRSDTLDVQSLRRDKICRLWSFRADLHLTFTTLTAFRSTSPN